MRRIGLTAVAVVVGVAMAMCVMSCRGVEKKGVTEPEVPQFPYQSYLDSVAEDGDFPVIGDDGGGFNAISHKMRYPIVPDTLKLSSFADSLLQLYNMALAFNTLAYDTGTADRYMSQPEVRKSHSDALDSINVDGISDPAFREMIRKIAHNAAVWIRENGEAGELSDATVDRFYDAYMDNMEAVIANHNTDEEFEPETVIDDYAAVHAKALSDKTSFRHELLMRTLAEPDFQKQCVLVREYAYANYNHPARDDKELVAVLDKILSSGKYSPLLGELWRMWRLTLQKELLGSPSNDGAMYNLLYNDMRNRVAMVYIAHLNDHPDDNIALKEFLRMTTTYNIVRNSSCMIGNNANLEDIELLFSVVNED